MPRTRLVGEGTKWSPEPRRCLCFVSGLIGAGVSVSGRMFALTSVRSPAGRRRARGGGSPTPAGPSARRGGAAVYAARQCVADPHDGRRAVARGPEARGPRPERPRRRGGEGPRGAFSILRERRRGYGRDGGPCTRPLRQLRAQEAALSRIQKATHQLIEAVEVASLRETDQRPGGRRRDGRPPLRSEADRGDAGSRRGPRPRSVRSREVEIFGANDAVPYMDAEHRFGSFRSRVVGRALPLVAACGREDRLSAAPASSVSAAEATTESAPAIEAASSARVSGPRSRPGRARVGDAVRRAASSPTRAIPVRRVSPIRARVSRDAGKDPHDNPECHRSHHGASRERRRNRSREHCYPNTYSPTQKYSSHQPPRALPLLRGPCQARVGARRPCVILFLPGIWVPGNNHQTT